MGFGSQVERFAIRRWGRHEAAVQFVRRQDFKRATGFEHGRRAFLTEEVQPAIGVDGRGGVFSANAFVPDDFSCGGFDSGDETVLRRQIEKAVNEQR